MGGSSSREETKVIIDEFEQVIDDGLRGDFAFVVAVLVEETMQEQPVETL
jgi:hypothetical protein